MTGVESYEPMPVKGYTVQSQQNLDLVNRNKHVEEGVLLILDDLKKKPETDQRWLAIGRTGIEQAFMAINRSVFKPQ